MNDDESFLYEARFLCTWCGHETTSRAKLLRHWIGNPTCSRNRYVNNPTQEKLNTYDPEFVTGRAEDLDGESGD